MKLKNLIEINGNPDAIVFSSDINKYYGIWGFEDIFITKNMGGNGDDILSDFQKTLNSWKKESNYLAAVGFFSYDSKQLFFPHLRFKPCNSGQPLIWFGKPKTIESLDKKEIKKLYRGQVDINKIKEVSPLDIYDDKINTIKTFLKAGDVYQINYTEPLEFNISNNKMVDVFSKIFNSANPDFGMYLDIKSHQILCFSPENFITKIDNKISSFPIKGTRPRSDDKDKDNMLKQELANSIKDKAEHVMIVDLVRNDLGKICEYGSVNVNNLFNIKSFETIHHMVTEVSGKLMNNINEIEIFKSLFPGGSITGAPKQRAVQIIDQIENYSRGIYTGSMGYIKPNGDMNFNVAIRTLSLENSLATYPVGGGIVWDSTSDDERNEAINKSEILNL